MSSQQAWIRRLRLLRTLLERGSVTTRAAQQIGGCNRRQALDDIQALERHRVGIHSIGEGRDTRWQLTDAWRRVGVKIGVKERLGLLFGKEMSAFLQPTLLGEGLDGLERALAPLDASGELPEAGLERRFVYLREPARDYSAHQVVIERLADAVARSYAIAFDYARAHSTTRRFSRVEPLSLIVHRRAVYLAFVESDDRLYTLSVERISALELRQGDTFKYPTESVYDPARLLRLRFGISGGRNPPERVAIRFSKKVAPYVTARQWAPDQQVEQLSDGGVRLTFVAEGQELVPFALQFGEHARVEAPKWLREKVASELRNAMAFYVDDK